MEDEEVYGPSFTALVSATPWSRRGSTGAHALRLSGRSACGTGRRRDTRHESRPEQSSEATARAINKTGLERHITRVYGTSLALNGEMEGTSVELPDRLRRVIAFSNTIDASKWYARALTDSKVRERTTPL